MGTICPWCLQRAPGYSSQVEDCRCLTARFCVVGWIMYTSLVCALKIHNL